MKLKLVKCARRVSLLLLLLLSAHWISAQSSISGTVTDAENGDPLIGAYILPVGTSSGAVTDIDGTYNLQVPEGVTELTFSYTGYTTQTIEIGTQTLIDVAMKPGAALEEVVVIGYGTVKREDATGSVETVSAEEFNKGAITSAQELVAGKVAGVQITTDGTPGGGATIRIRGGSSLSASNDPLIIIDGVPLPTDDIDGSRNPLSLINPNDIETFTVLKDASATAIYGSRASNGVVIITTKKGKAGSKLQLSYNGSVGVSTRAREFDVLSADDFRNLINERFEEGSAQRELLGPANTDWQEEIYQDAIFHNHNVSASGAIKSVPYRVSLGYTDQEGLLRTDEFQRLTYGINLNPGFFSNRLQIQAGLKGVNTNNNFGNRAAIGSATAYNPTQPVFQDNAFGGYYFEPQENGNPNTLAPDNPVALIEQRSDESTVNRYIANFTADYRFSFLPALRANLNMAYDWSESEGTIFEPDFAAFVFNPVDTLPAGTDNFYSQEKQNELFEFYLNYNRLFGNVRVDAIAGYSWQNFFREGFSSNGDARGIERFENRNPEEYYLVSVFGRANLTFNDRLILTATLRRDGSSRFSEDNRWGLFPSAAIAYKLIDVDDNPRGLNSLKLRAGYGVTGQQEAGGYYPSQALYLISQDNARYQFGDRFISTLRPEGYNSNLKWEETTNINFAVDFGFFNDRLNGSVEVYQRETSDLLNFIPVPAGTNLTNFITSNVGDLENTGFEISLNGTPIQTRNSSLSVGINFTMNDNEITRLTATEDPNFQGVPTGGIAGGVGNNIQINSVGFPANSFYVYEQVYDQNGTPVEGVYVDRNNDGVVNTADLYRYENPAPDAFIGFTVNYDINNFDFSFAGRGNFGNHVYNNNLSSRAFYDGLFNSTGFLTNTLPEIREIDFNQARFFSDHFVQDASFLRIDHITAGYTFSDIFRAGSSLRAYFTVQNPILITDYDGIDPEVFGGIDNNIYPRARTFLFGVGANF